MISFEVKDMTCGHCISTITKALAAVDEGARVQFDLRTHRVQIESSTGDAGKLREAIRDAGYTPVAVEATATPAAVVGKPASKGCCCG